MTDQELLQRFLSTRDEQAFAELVARHIGLVYASARRQMKNAGAAEDVTQSVFILLAQKAGKIRSAASIPGWLLITTRCVALNAIRAQIRRQRHESEAAGMKQESQSPDVPAWESIGPLLDEAVAALRPDDRDALVLRYFQNQPLIDIASVLGVSEPAARKRVQRAVERLRKFFASRGIMTSAEGLGALLPAHVLVPAPSAALSAQVAHAAASKVAFKGGTILMAITKTKIAIACAIAAVTVGVSGTVAYLAIDGEQPAVASVPIVQPAPAAASQPAGNWRDRFNRIYMLNPGETIKYVAAPFPQERVQYLNESIQGIPRPPDMIVFEADGPALQRLGMVFGAHALRNVLSPVAHLLPAQTNLPQEMLDLSVTGDWIIRKGATQAERIDGVTTALPHIFGPGMTLKPNQVEREAIVVRGTFNTSPSTAPDGSTRAPNIRFTRNASVPPNNSGTSNGKASEMLMSLGENLKMPVVLEADYDGQRVNWSIEPSADLRRSNNPPDPAVVDEILATVSGQTSLQLKRERRTVTIWQLEPK